MGRSVRHDISITIRTLIGRTYTQPKRKYYSNLVHSCHVEVSLEDSSPGNIAANPAISKVERKIEINEMLVSLFAIFLKTTFELFGFW